MKVRIIMCFALLAEISGSQICVSPPDFADYCANQYAGVAVGGRCFFLARNASSNNSLITTQWDSAFGTCQSQGGNAVLAQIYTETEMSAIWTKFKPYISHPAFLWISLRNLATVPATPNTTHVINADSHWYSDASTYDPSLTANSTFLRYRVSDDIQPGDDECFVLYQHPVTKDMRFGDMYCVYPLLVLCQATNCQQGFDLTTGCFSEAPIQTPIAEDMCECAKLCAKEIWCRTFNFRCQTPTSYCELFAIHVEDAISSVKDGQSDCTMYAYVN